MDILRIDNLIYKDIINSLDLVLKSNTFNILLGKNSSGKTTLVNSILDLNNYTGNINLFISRNEIGVVTEKNKLLDNTVLYNLMYPLINLGYSESLAKKTAYDFSKKFGLDSILLKNINEISKKEYKLIQIILSFIHSPKLMIIDDSLNDLDYVLKHNVLEYLKELSKTTCVLILTSNTEFLEYADNIILFDSGKVLDVVKYEDLIKIDKIFNKLNLKLPFIIDLSLKLKFYGLINKDYKSIEDVVMDIWK